MMTLFNKITLIVLCSLTLALLSCRQAIVSVTPDTIVLFQIKQMWKGLVQKKEDIKF